MKAFRPKFLLTVPESLYQATCDKVSQDFAESYLSGAKLDGQYLHPRTRTGWAKMAQDRAFMALLKELQITLVKVDPYPGDGDRLSAAELARGNR